LSIIHNALKRAEDERKPRGGSFDSPGYVPERQSPKRQAWQLLLSIGALCLGLAALVAAISLLVFPRTEISGPQLAGQLPNSALMGSKAPIETAAEIPSVTNRAAVSEKSEGAVASSEPILSGQERAQNSSALQRMTPKAKPAPTSADARRTEDSPKSLSISMSPDEPSVLKIGPGQRVKEGKIDIRSVGRVKTALELRRERRAVCLSHLREAQRLANRGEKELAREQFEEASSTESENELALLGFGGFLLSIDRPVLAESYLRRGVAVETAAKGVKSLLYGNLGLSLFNQGLAQDAIKAYQTAIAINDENLNAYNNLAIAFKKLGKRELAQRTYSRLLIVKSKAPMAYYGLGLLNDEDGKLDEAIFHYARFLVLAGRRHGDLQEKVKKSATSRRLGFDACCFCQAGKGRWVSVNFPHRRLGRHCSIIDRASE